MYNQQTYEVCKKIEGCDKENTNFAKYLPLNALNPSLIN
jgi:hypothetical protein